MEQLPSVLLQVVLSKVSAPDCARAACVARLWHFVAHQELQWKSYCQSDFQLDLQPRGPLRSPVRFLEGLVRPNLLTLSWGNGLKEC
jgi:hypothetical protein